VDRKKGQELVTTHQLLMENIVKEMPQRGNCVINWLAFLQVIKIFMGTHLLSGL
jgi:hypothetical protein